MQTRRLYHAGRGYVRYGCQRAPALPQLLACATDSSPYRGPRPWGITRSILLANVAPRRTLFEGVSPFVLAPGMFIGLLIGYWVQKCCLMVLFQNKIVYMPSLPPGSRREKLETYSPSWGPLAWREEHIRSLDGAKLALAIGKLKAEHEPLAPQLRRHSIIVYFQGNGASLPPRTSMLSNVLKPLVRDPLHQWTLVGLSYRGYWTSSGRAHQRGIEKDAEAVLQWINTTYATDAQDVDLVLWGQSIGAGVASFAAAKYFDNLVTAKQPIPISSLILETPFVSIKSMLRALYPDWWVPYKHLWPFLRSWWDTDEALRKIAKTKAPPRVLLMVAARDEIVPRAQADQLEKLCAELKLDVQREDVLGALHTQASTLEHGKKVIVRFLSDEASVFNEASRKAHG